MCSAFHLYIQQTFIEALLCVSDTLCLLSLVGETDMEIVILQQGKHNMEKSYVCLEGTQEYPGCYQEIVTPKLSLTGSKGVVT